MVEIAVEDEESGGWISLGVYPTLVVAMQVARAWAAEDPARAGAVFGYRTVPERGSS